jgi:hypothetical protein
MIDAKQEKEKINNKVITYKREKYTLLEKINQFLRSYVTEGKIEKEDEKKKIILMKLLI